MRRSVLLGVAAAVIAVAGTLAATLPPPHTASSGQAHITRLFIPAIKADCRERDGIAPDIAIGYTFTTYSALTTIDRDGSLTGIDPAVLQDFNRCLARYPIEDLPALPHDHYTRNLLYDYLSGVLRPCLAGRVAADLVPPLPSRADFVVRLYVWDPYRVIAPTRTLQQLIDLSAACPELPAYLDLPSPVPVFFE